MTSSENKTWGLAEYAKHHAIVFRAAFDFLSAHFPPQDDPEWWKQLSIDMSNTSEQVKGGKLIDGFLTAIGDYLEEEYKGRKGG